MAGRRTADDSDSQKSNLPTSQNRDDVVQDGTTDGSQERLSERHYRVPVKDSQGHSERITLRVHPNYLPVMNKILGSKKFPFRTTNDIVRYAIDRTCRELERKGEIPSMMRQIDAMWDFLNYEEDNINYLRNFELMQRQVQDLASSPEEAAKLLAGAKQYIENMPDGYWKGRYRQELLTRFGHLLRVEAGKGASLIDGDES